MSYQQIQSIINKGNGIAAKIIGEPCNWYRPTAMTFIDPTTLQGTINAYFDPKADLGAKTPSTFAHPQWYVAVNRTDLMAGDYLVNPSGNIYFINVLEALTPTGAILTNGTITVYRPGADQTYGNNYYGGNPTGTGTTILMNCPASLLQGTKGEKDDSGLVGQPREPWVSIVMPNIAGVILKEADIIIDNQARRYQASSIETTTLGVRLTASYVGT